MITAPATRGSHDGGVIKIWFSTCNTPSGTRPAAVHTIREPVTNAAVGQTPSPRARVTDAKASVIGATGGNIIATIITSHVMRNSPAPIAARPPIAVELAWPIVTTHATAPHRTSATTIVAASGR